MEVRSECNYSDNIYLITFYSEVFSTLFNFSRNGESIPMPTKSLYASLRGKTKLPATVLTQDTGMEYLGEDGYMAGIRLHG